VVITQQPEDVSVPSGETATVTFTAEGEGLTYKWYYKNKGVAGWYLTTAFTGNTYTVTMNSTRNGRQIYCVVTDKNGNSVQTNTVTLSQEVSKAVTITQQPVSVCAPEGETATVTFTAEGDGLTYKWYFKNKGTSTFYLTTSFTGNTYTVTMDDSRNGREVYCVVKDQYGNTVQTNTVSLDKPVEISQQPEDTSAPDGGSLSVTVTASGNGLSYKWYFRNKNSKTWYPSSITADTYTVTMDSTRDGRQLYCLVKDAYGNTVQSEEITISVQADPVTITQQPTDISVPNGEKATVSFTAEGEGLTYKWYFKNKGVKGWYLTTSFTGNSYTLTMDETRDGRQVYCVVKDKYGNTVQTNTVTIALDPDAPTIVERGKCGANVTWTLDEAGTLTVSGTGPMEDYPCWESPISEFSDRIYKLTITEGITAIGEYAFAGCGMNTLIIPNSVITIGEGAFFCGQGIQTVILGNSVTTIGRSAFNYCDGMKNITIPVSIATIESSAFYESNWIENVYYAGTETQWNDINFGVENDPLLQYPTIHFESVN